jgi:hypothetical protein
LASLSPRRAGIAVGAGALAVGAWALNHSLVGGFYDDGLYAGIAIALGKGMGYVHPHLPGAPAVVHYPPLYPLLLAPLFAAFPVSAAAFLGLILNLLLAALGAGLIAAHAVRIRVLGEMPAWLAPACVLGAAVAIPVLTVQSVLFAEPLFGLLLAGAVVLADGAPERRRPRRAAALAGGLAALALLTRSIALAAATGLPLYLLVSRRRPWREAIAAGIPVLVAAAGWGAWIVARQGGLDPALAINYGGYGETVRQAGLGVIWRSVPDLLRPLGALTLGWLPSVWIYYPVGAAALSVGIYGLVLLTRRSAIGLTLVGYLVILALWPFPSDRFLWAVLPWLALTFAAGAVGLVRAMPRIRVAVLVVVAIVIIGYAQYEIRGALGRWWGLQRERISDNFAELLPGLAALPDSTVLATDDEALVWLYTRRTAVPFYLYGYRNGVETEPTAAEHRRYLERQGVTRVLFSGFGSGSDRELDALLGAYPGWLTMERAWPRGRALFRVNRGP